MLPEPKFFYGAVNLHVEGAPGQREIIYAHWGGEFGVAAGRVALVAVGQLLNLSSDGGATEALVLRSSDYARKVMSHIRAKWLDQSTAALVLEAVKRGIPWRRIGPETCFAKLGYGRLQKTINETVSHHTSSNAVWMSHNKAISSRLLAEIGLPVPRQSVLQIAANNARR